MDATRHFLIGFILAIYALSVARANGLGLMDLKYINLGGDLAFSCRSEPATSYVAIQSRDQWSEYCDPQSPSLAASQKVIDFDHYTLLVAHAGARPNLSYMLLSVTASFRFCVNPRRQARSYRPLDLPGL